jgi:hypothetical protein
MKIFLVIFQHGWQSETIEVKAKDYAEARKKAIEKMGADILIQDVQEKNE